MKIVTNSIDTQKMMMKTNIRKFFFYFLVVDSLVIGISLVMQGMWLLNTQVAFVCSFLISIATFLSYKRLVERRVETRSYAEDKRYDDPYELYDEEDEPEASTEVEVKPVQKKGFKENLRNLALGSWGALSPLRLGAYAVLFLTILALIRHNVFEPIAFFVGLSVVPLGSLFLGNKGLE